MNHVLIIGSGLSGLTCALELASKGIRSTLVSPYPSERAQSVMAAGGINAALSQNDSPRQHAEDTLKSGGNIAGEEAVSNLCLGAAEIIQWLESLGVVFSIFCRLRNNFNTYKFCIFFCDTDANGTCSAVKVEKGFSGFKRSIFLGNTVKDFCLCVVYLIE